MKNILVLFLFLSFFHCQVEDYRNLIPGEKEKAERKKEREKALNCILQTALCFYGPTLSGEQTPARRYISCSDLGNMQVSRPCFGWDGM